MLDLYNYTILKNQKEFEDCLYDKAWRKIEDLDIYDIPKEYPCFAQCIYHSRYGNNCSYHYKYIKNIKQEIKDLTKLIEKAKHIY